MRRRASTGFTLLELLVAVAIFAVVAALAYGGLASVLDAREQTDAAAQKLRALQQSFHFLERDLDQASTRAIRDEYGTARAALLGGPDWLEFTHGGWANPGGQTRSELQRVAYAVRDQQLIRAHWLVLDRAQDSAPYEAPLLDGVRALHLRFLNTDGQWSEDWPALAQSNLPIAAVPLPQAVEIAIELEGWGTVTRLLRLPGLHP